MRPVAVNALTVEDITVDYDGTLALDGFSLDVAPGEIMAVVGPSGSGKSTLLRAIAGLEPLMTGRITLGEQDLDGVPTHRRNLGLMFQDHGLFSHLDVADNIGYGLKTAGVDKPGRRKRVAELLELVGLEQFGSRATSELSGGEAQRVALARALAPKPGLLMLDEPLGSLDRALRDQLTGDLRRLLTELGQTALHVTHDQAEAFALADRVAVVSAGRPVLVGTPSDLWSDPKTRFVAEFLGHPNIWTVTIGSDGDVRWNGHRLGVLPSGHRLRAEGGGTRLAVMPATGLAVERDGHADEAKPGVADGGRPGSIKVSVTESVFRAGVYDITAMVASAERDGTDGSTVQFTAAQPVTAGQSLLIRADVELLAPLDP